MKALSIVAGAVLTISLSAANSLAQPATSQPGELETLSKTELVERILEFQTFTLQTQAQFSVVMKRLDALTAQLTSAAEERGRLNSDLARLRAQQAQNAGGEAELERTRRQLAEAIERAAAIQKQFGDMATKLAMAEKNAVQCSQKLAEVVAQRDYLLQQVKIMKEQIVLLKERLSGEPPQPVPASQPDKPKDGQVIKARIAEVRGRSAVINVGLDNGVKPGMEFVISRGGAYLGKFEVREVGKQVSMGLLLDIYKPVEPGDSCICTPPKAVP